MKSFEEHGLKIGDVDPAQGAVLQRVFEFLHEVVLVAFLSLFCRLGIKL